MVNKPLAALLAGLFPHYCLLCGLRSNQSLPLCQDCELELQPNRVHCYCCAIPLSPTLPHCQDLRCGNCLRAPPPFERVLAPWLYCERLAHLIKRWKFQGERRLTPLLAALWLRRIKDIPEVDVLIPVPLHWRRHWQRGFNQSQLLCRQLHSGSTKVGAARLDYTTVKRRRATPAQSGMGAIARSVNMSGVFTARNRYDNLRVAIIDDVFTTGATATAMANTLRVAGADHVEVWCLARTPGPSH